MCILNRIFIVVIFYTLSSIAYAEISIGLGAQTWPFMLKENTSLADEIPLSNSEYTKWSVSESNLDLLKKIGAQWNFIDVWQEQDGPDNFNKYRSL